MAPSEAVAANGPVAFDLPDVFLRSGSTRMCYHRPVFVLSCGGAFWLVEDWPVEDYAGKQSGLSPLCFV